MILPNLCTFYLRDPPRYPISIPTLAAGISIPVSPTRDTNIVLISFELLKMLKILFFSSVFKSPSITGYPNYCA